MYGVCECMVLGGVFMYGVCVHTVWCMHVCVCCVCACLVAQSCLTLRAHGL